MTSWDRDSVGYQERDKTFSDIWFFITSSADGQFNSYLVRGLAETRRKVAEEYFFGTFDEALKDEVTSHVIMRFDDPDEWSGDHEEWKDEGEQCWLRVNQLIDADAIESYAQQATDSKGKQE